MFYDNPRSETTVYLFFFGMVTYLQLQFRLQLCILVFDFRQASSGRECPLCRQRHTPTPNPNLITDANPKISKKTKRHRNEIEHRVIYKSRFPRDRGGFIKGL